MTVASDVVYNSDFVIGWKTMYQCDVDNKTELNKIFWRATDNPLIVRVMIRVLLPVI